MKILYLCHRIPFPPNKGEKIRAFHELRALGERHEVDLFTLADRKADLTSQSELRSYCRQVTVATLNPAIARIRALPYLASQTPLSIPYFHSTDLQKSIRKALLRRSYDRIFVYCSSMAQYVGEALGRAPAIMDMVDVDSDKWGQYATRTSPPWSSVYRREARLLRNYERAACEKMSTVVVSTEREACLVREICPAARVETIPNGVDQNYFHPSGRLAGEAPEIIFTGDMSYFPNADAVSFFSLEVLPKIRRSVPEARFVIVGHRPSRDVRRLAKLPGVEVTGFVPDVRTRLARAQVAVAPFRIAAGIQNKVLEALASGLPVVATRRVLQGLSSRVAEAVCAGDDSEDLAEAVVGLLLQPEMARQRGIEGRCRVAEEYTWQRSLDRLLRLVEEDVSVRFEAAVKQR